MSFFARPDSPPPRSPSPEVVLASLPPPRRRQSRPTHLSLQSTDQRPKPTSQRKLATMRSCGDLRHPQTPKSAARSAFSVPPTPRSLAPSSPSGSSFRRGHTRTLSFAVPYRSPPASPTISSPPPPVPRIPEFVLSPTDKKPVLHSPAAAAPTRVNHIYLPEWEQFTVAPPPLKTRASMTSMSSRGRTASPPAPMTCSTFFALHNEHQRPNRVMAL
ncbi:hypothetical protein DFH06DRAFT_1161763 [Mycena polygramma]|nr:hypothetical protein DFH06DRAFT_1161763 [Mycena polygramma]